MHEALNTLTTVFCLYCLNPCTQKDLPEKTNHNTLAFFVAEYNTTPYSYAKTGRENNNAVLTSETIDRKDAHPLVAMAIASVVLLLSVHWPSFNETIFETGKELRRVRVNHLRVH